MKPQVELDETRLNHSAFQSESAAFELSTALTNLSEDQRKAIEMRCADGLEFSEIAKRLKTSSVNVRKIISRSLKRLRGEL